MASDHGETYRKWLAERENVPLAPPRPCYDCDWEMDLDDFQKKHPGEIHMHTTMLKILQIFDIAGMGKKPTRKQWLALFQMNIDNIIIADGADPDYKIAEDDIDQKIVRAVCIYFRRKQNSNDEAFVPDPAVLAFIRQFAMNLACSSTSRKKEQLMSYTTSLKKQSNLHRAYDMALQLLGPLQPGVLLKAAPKKAISKTKKAPPLPTAKVSTTNSTAVAAVAAHSTAAATSYDTLAHGRDDTDEYLSRGEDADDDDEDELDKSRSNTSGNKKRGAVPINPIQNQLPVMSITEIVDLMIQSINEEKLVLALQDVGTQVQKKKGQSLKLETTFPKLQDLAAIMRKNAWQPFKNQEKDLPEFLQKRTTTRVQIGIVSYLDVKRKQVPIRNVYESIRKIISKNFPQESPSEIYALYPEEKELMGLRSILTNHLEELRLTYNQKTKKTDENTPNDAARLVSILLEEEHRVPVAYWLSKKRTKEEQDLAVPHKKAFLKTVAKDFFNNSNYIAKSPEDTGSLEWDPVIDPNDVSESIVL
jgi:hypothetical protein